MTTTEINKRLAELAGICWHKWDEVSFFVMGCTKCGLKGDPNKHPNPDFCADPRLVLEVMKTKCLFMNDLFRECVYHGMDWFLFTYILDTTGKLALAAIGFLEEVARRKV
jgi:hypothetical protein